MAATKMKIETNELKKSATLIEDKTAKYDTEWGKIYTEIQSLKVEWQGQSSDEFNKQIEGYRNDFQELAKVLRSYAEFLKSVADRTEKTENAIKEAAGKLYTGK